VRRSIRFVPVLARETRARESAVLARFGFPIGGPSVVTIVPADGHGFRP
jgi:hypothetical protein